VHVQHHRQRPAHSGRPDHADPDGLQVGRFVVDRQLGHGGGGLEVVQGRASVGRRQLEDERRPGGRLDEPLRGRFHNLGRLDDAERTDRTLLRQAEAVGNDAFTMNARVILCGLAVYRGELIHARELLAPILSATESEETLRATRLRLADAWLTAEEGDPERALGIVRPLLAEADNGCHSWPWSPAWMRVFAGIARSVDDHGAARQAALIADLGARRNPGVASLHGLALHVRGYLDDDPATLAQAVAVLRRSPRRLLLADALRDQGSHHEALTLYEELGAHGYARALRTGHPELRAPHRRRPRAAQGWEALTETEASEIRRLGLRGVS
jgi:hypothetical protein